MMVAGTIAVEFDTALEPRIMWNATIKDGPNLMPQLLPQLYTSVKILEGDGGVGTIIETIFTPVNESFSYVKERVEEFDEASFVYAYSHLEGGELGKRLASAKFRLKWTPKAGGGCVCTWTCEYDTLPGVCYEVKVAEMKAHITATFRIIEGYLLSNATAYC